MVRTTLGYRLGSGLMALLSRVLADWQVEGTERVPHTGPLIVAANHFSFIDPPLLSASFPRPLTFSAKAELWRSLPSRLFCRAMGVFPVRRGEADRGAVRAALAVLDSGGCIALFPEGTRGRGWPKALKRARPGVAFLARVSGAPVVPVGIAGTEVIDTPGEIAPNLLRRPVFRVRIGDPISLGDVGATRRDTERATDMVMRAIAQLLPCRYWGAYQPAMEHR